VTFNLIHAIGLNRLGRMESRGATPLAIVIVLAPASDPPMVNIAIRAGELTWSATCPTQALIDIFAEPEHADFEEYVAELLPSCLRLSTAGVQQMADHVRLFLETQELWDEEEALPSPAPENVFRGAGVRVARRRPYRFPSPLNEPLLKEDGGSPVFSELSSGAGELSPDVSPPVALPTDAGTPPAAADPLASADPPPNDYRIAVLPPDRIDTTEEFFVWLYMVEPDQRMRIQVWANDDLPVMDILKMSFDGKNRLSTDLKQEAQYIWPRLRDERHRDIQKIFDARRRQTAGRLNPLLDL
jgi:hypothetical protein